LTHSVALIGLGAIGLGYDLPPAPTNRITTHARAFKSHAAFGPLIAVDRALERRRIFEAIYGGSTYATVTDALGRSRPNVVVIATPTASHREVLTEVLDNSSPQLVLCEKPLAPNPEDAHWMVSACGARGVALYANYMRRADPAVNAVKAMLDDERIRGPLKGVAWYSKGLVHNGSHFVDLLRHWLGPVTGASVVRTGRRWEGHDPEPDCVLDFSGGSVSFLAASEECFSHYTVELVARNGRLRYERGGERVEWQGVIDDPECAGFRILGPGPQLLPADMTHYQLNVVRQLADALDGRATTLCVGDEALQTLQDIYRVIGML
jgi:predicted dehydrogenase